MVMTATELRAALSCGSPRCACQRPQARVTHCPAHADRTPSLGVDERNGRTLVIDRSGRCTQSEVIAALRARNLWPPAAAPPAPRPARSLLAEARAEIIKRALREPWARPGVLESYRIADFLRGRLQLAARARRKATAIGDRPEAWGLAELAAHAELEAFGVEAELDA